MNKVLISLVFIFSLCFVSAQEVRFKWKPNSESDLAGYRLYSSTNLFVSNFTNFVDVGNVTNATYELKTSGTTAFYITAYNTAKLESDPSNELRFRLLLATAASNITNSFTLTGFTNWQSAILTKSPTNGIITGTPPNIFYRSTNVTATKDNFTYSIQKQPMAGTEHPVTNYFTVYYLFPNTPPVISSVISLSF